MRAGKGLREDLLPNASLYRDGAEALRGEATRSVTAGGVRTRTPNSQFQRLCCPYYHPFKPPQKHFSKDRNHSQKPENPRGRRDFHRRLLYLSRTNPHFGNSLYVCLMMSGSPTLVHKVNQGCITSLRHAACDSSKANHWRCDPFHCDWFRDGHIAQCEPM